MTVILRAFFILCLVPSVLNSVHAKVAVQDSSSTSRQPGAQRPQRTARAPRPPNPGTFASLDSALLMPDSVVVLYLRGKAITKLPKEVARFVNMQSADFGACGLTTFPKELLHCKKLSSLNLSDNPIGSVPNEIDSLGNLNRLSLRNTGITTLPASIGNCKQLLQIDLQGNPLTSLPIGEINRLPRLRNFGIGGYTVQQKSAPSDPSVNPPTSKPIQGARGR